MEKLLIVGCKKTMDESCIACTRCLVAFNRRDGEFGRYKGQKVELIGIMSCGDCPGIAMVPRLANMKLWISPLQEKPTKIHLAPCLANHCPHGESIINKIKAKAGIEIVKGTHSFQIATIFG